MNYQTVFAMIATVALSFGPVIVADAQSGQTKKERPAMFEKYVAFPNAGVRLVQPSGFTPATSFDGFEHKTGASVVVMRIPGPYAEVTRGFDTAALKARGITLVTKEDMKIDGLSGVLLNVTQEAHDIVFAKWIAAFGDPSQTILVTASFPQEQTRSLSARLKASVLSARRDKKVGAKPGADITFTLTPSTKLKPASGLGKMLLFTKEGIVPAKNPSDPLFVATPSLGDPPVADRGEYALNRLRQTAHTTVTKITSNQPIGIDDMDGFEIIAEAKDTTSGLPLTLYQVMLFEEDSYFLMQGLVGKEQSAAYLPEFKAMARSLRRKS
ncbi:MAG: hypothetical protein H7Z41_15685 [Cytophagales bacterium]|nr:hypothetical protein [Armatimonadota bacterium]